MRDALPRPNLRRRLEDRRRRLRETVLGVALGALLAVAARPLLDGFLQIDFARLLVAAVLGGLLGAVGAVRGLLAACWLYLLLLFVVLGTPISGRLIRSILVEERPGPASAVMVLAAEPSQGGWVGTTEQLRLARGYELLAAGLASHLIISRPVDAAPYADAVRRHLAEFHLRADVVEIEPSTNTHQEALHTKALIERAHWGRLILVTSPYHLRRALATFRKAGVDAAGAASEDTRYNLDRPLGFGRVFAIHDWLHEVLGYRIYQLRGWI